MTDIDDLVIGKQGVAAMYDWDGVPVAVGPGTIVRKGHPMLRGHEDLFEPLKIHYDYEKPAARRSEEAPVSSVRADQRGARSR